MSFIKLDNVSKYYKSAETVSVGMKNINLSFDIGEFVAITGESGAGKSTLLNVLSGLDKYEEGEYYLAGEETSHYTIRDWEKFRGAYIGFIFQDYNIIDSYTVLQNVLLALEVQGYDQATRKQRALDLIDKVGLTSHKNHKASKLSGGQKQRCVIARALAKDCPIIVADEPTGNLDSKSGEQVLNLLHEVSKDKLVIIVTHDYDHVEPYVTRKITMHDGDVTEDKKIKKADIEEAKVVQPIKNMNFLLLMKFAFRNLLSTPKKLIFMMLMQIVVVAVFTVVYTNQISQIRETGLDSGYAQTYTSVPDTRVLVEKRDGSTFTSTELTSLEKIRYVDEVYENGLNFFNDQGVYFKMNDYGYSNYRSLGDTDTASQLIASDVEGRLPENKNEIVITSYDYYSINLNQTLELYAGPSENGFYFDDMYVGYPGMNTNYELIEEFVVVGFDKLDRDRIYFYDDFLKQSYDDIAAVDPMINKGALSEIRSIVADTMYATTPNFNFNYVQVDDFISDYDIVIDYYENRLTTPIVEQRDITFTFDLPGYGSHTVTLTNQTIIRYVELNTFAYLSVSDDLYSDIVNQIVSQMSDYYTNDSPTSIVSLSVSGRHDATKLINQIDQTTYKVYYPANLADPLRDFYVFLYSVLAIFFLALFGMFLYSIVHAVTKNVMAARKRDFAIFRSVGTSQTTLGRLVVIEQVMMNVVAFIITIIGIQILSNNVSLIRAALTYMEVSDYIILLLAFALFGAWLGLRFNKKVFKQTVIETLTASKGGE